VRPLARLLSGSRVLPARPPSAAVFTNRLDIHSYSPSYIS
jgi:hypothetical protein